jgi:Uncharacterized lipoprotein
VEIRGFRYQIAQGFFVNKNQVDAVFYVLAARGKSQYEHVHRASVEQGSQVALTADNNTAMLNDALSDVLSQICIDDELLHTLATPSHQHLAGLRMEEDDHPDVQRYFNSLADCKVAADDLKSAVGHFLADFALFESFYLTGALASR